MSLVNQMLRDLDQRQSARNVPAFGQHLQPVAEGHRIKWGAIAGGLAIALAAAVVIARSTDRQPALPAPVATASNPAPTAIAEPVAPVVIAAAPSLLVTPSVAAAPTPSVPRKADTAAARSGAPASAPKPPKAPTAAASSRPNASTAPEQPISAAAAAVTAARNAAMEAASANTRRETLAKAATAASPNSAPTRIDKTFTDTPERTAEASFRRAAALIERGRLEDALQALRAALAVDGGHAGARQTLAALLVESRRTDEAEQVLRDGLQRDPAQSSFALVLARIALERGDTAGALELLRKHRAAANGNAQYLGFLAALLQRSGQHPQAVEEYQAALRLAPSVAVWWVGLGLSHEALERRAEATVAFQQAKASGALSADLADFVERKLAGAR